MYTAVKGFQDRGKGKQRKHMEAGGGEQSKAQRGKNTSPLFPLRPPSHLSADVRGGGGKGREKRLPRQRTEASLTCR